MPHEKPHQRRREKLKIKTFVRFFLNFEYPKENILLGIRLHKTITENGNSYRITKAWRIYSFLE